jgi:hypothetical protein
MENIDKMTLELLMNKSKYNKYIAKTDPKKYDEQQQECAKIQKYAERIANLTEELLNNPYKPIQNDINDSFMNYVKTCIYHFEIKDYEKRHEKDSYEKDDVDEESVLFGEMDNDANNTDSEYNNQHQKTTSSYWGKSIKKMNAAMTMDAYVYSKNKKV